MKRIGFLMVAAALTAACGGSGETSAPPTSPVTTSSATANGSSGTSSADGTKTGTTTRAEGITGTISDIAGACPNVTFKVEGKVVKTDSATTYVEKGCADLKDGVRVGVMGTTQADGSVLAKQVKFAPPPPPPPALTEGTVSALSGTCPAITFTVAGKTFTTDAQTRYGDGGCAAVQNGVKVVVQSQATTAGGARVLAVKVIPPPPPPPALTEGTVSALSGTCPTITFTVASKTFTTDAQTRYGDGGCAAVQNGVKVVVQSQATTAGGTRVLAVKVIPPPPPPPALSGEVTAVTGTCPAITITLGTKVAVTSAATVFTGKTCADVKVGSKVGIYGTIAAGATTLTATKVVIR